MGHEVSWVVSYRSVLPPALQLFLVPGQRSQMAVRESAWVLFCAGFALVSSAQGLQAQGSQ